jgi:hypothetical protein
MYALEENGRTRLNISWKGSWKNLSVRLDDDLIGTLPTREELMAGREFALPDGSSLQLLLLKSHMTTDLKILRDGRPIPGSTRTLTSKFREAYGIVFVIAGLNLLLGIAAMLFPVEFLRQIAGPPSIIFGMIYFVLGLFVRRRSMIALLIAILLFTVLTILGVVGYFVNGASSGSVGLIVRFYLIWLMIQGIGAIKLLESEERANQQQGAPNKENVAATQGPANRVG